VVEVASLIVAALALAWGVFSHIQARRERRRHESIVEDLRLRSEAMTELSGLLREVQHCTDEHAGEPNYRDRLERSIEKARALVLRYDRLLGEDVIVAVQRETDLARKAFASQLRGEANEKADRDLHAARNQRVALVQRLGTQVAFPPPAGSLSKETA
jgi:hypothetical protein